MQIEIKDRGPLLNEKGELAAPGWMRRPLLTYRRSDVKAPGHRIKEWDYYAILSGTHGLALTVADNGYMGFVAATVFDFEKPEEISRSVMTPFPMGRMGMPEESQSGEVRFSAKGCQLRFSTAEETRRVTLHWARFAGTSDLDAEIVLAERKGSDSMVIATPFKRNPRAFYYNRKINNLAAEGFVRLGGREFPFGKGDYGVLDWGRGVWTYQNTWYWGSLSAEIDGVPFGFNIGYGFGDTAKATENMLFHDGKAHKLEEVVFHIPETGYTEPWRFSSSDGRLEMDFIPILDRASRDNLLVIKSDQHQVFGRFSGTAILDSGKRITFQDKLGFAEKVMNRW